jgi:hypothetical protein
VLIEVVELGPPRRPAGWEVRADISADSHIPEESSSTTGLSPARTDDRRVEWVAVRLVNVSHAASALPYVLPRNTANPLHMKINSGSAAPVLLSNVQKTHPFCQSGSTV